TAEPVLSEFLLQFIVRLGKLFPVFRRCCGFLLNGKPAIRSSDLKRKYFSFCFQQLEDIVCYLFSSSLNIFWRCGAELSVFEICQHVRPDISCQALEKLRGGFAAK